MAYIRWSILFRTLCKYNIYRILMHSKLKHIQNSRHSRYSESLKYSLHRTLRNLDIFTTYVYSSPSTLRIRGIWWIVFYRTLCDTGIFRTRSIFQTLSNIYYGEFYLESCVTLSYLKPWHIQNQRHIHNTVKHLSWNILFIFLCNPGIFRTLLYSPLWCILKNKHIQNPTEYIRWSILLRILCNTAYLDGRYIRNIRLFRTRVCQLLLNLFHATGLFLYLLKTSENICFSDVFRGYRNRPAA